jgi:enamine deaminase RidA (YjgF/YER057c/UK114 family)/rhodanese-related sulfurtransferase
MEITRHEVGPRFAQLVVRGDTAYLAGQIADDFDGDVRAQAVEVFAKIDALLAGVGSSKSQLLSMNVWIADFADYAAFNEAYDAWIDPGAKPARATVRAELLDPRLRVEIMAVAAVPAVAGSSQRSLDAATAEISYVEPSDAVRRLDDPQLLFVDVRERHERAEGFIPGSLHAPRGLLEFHLDPASELHLPELAGERTLVMVCGSGGRGALATQLAQRHSLSSMCLRGGMRGWREAGGPTEAASSS